MRTACGSSSSNRNIPRHTADRHDGRLLARVDFYNAAGPVIAQPGDDHSVTSLEARPGVNELLFPRRLAL